MHFSPHQQLISRRQLIAQLLASVVQQLFPHVILAGGGSYSIGFYYDFIFQQPLPKNILELIEVQLQQFIREGHQLRFISMMRENAQTLFQHQHHDLLAYLINEEPANILELVQVGDFYALCPDLRSLRLKK